MIIMSIDFGTKKIGLAIGQHITYGITILKPVFFKKKINWNKIHKKIKEWLPKKIIVGLPLKLNGKKQKTTYRAINFAKKIQKKFNIKTIMQDERLTTFEAHQIIKNKKKNKYVDSISAALILESWFLTKKKLNFL